MNDAQFWSLIDSTRRCAEDDPDAHIEALTAALAELPEPEIIEFDRRFNEHWIRAYTWDLWAAAYIIGGGCSDDGFMDFRGWLIARGREVYEAALADPQSLVKVVKDEDDECQIEGYQYAAGHAWARKTGKDYVDFPYPQTAPYPEEPSGEKWTEEDLPRRFPKLWRKFS
jgi:hypothetical protein